jgi:hypothetical protein
MDGPTITARVLPLLAYFRGTSGALFAEGTPAGGAWLLPAAAGAMDATWPRPARGLRGGERAPRTRGWATHGRRCHLDF